MSNLVNDVNNRMKGQGSETRTSLLPSMIPADLGFFGSPYQPSDAMKTPPQINVRVGDSMSDVVNAVKGVGFYTDQIGFGAPSSGLTNGMPLQPLGVNYFMNTGAKCSNGATMWEYIQGIPDGSAMGEKVKSVMAEMGLPALRGLAPGMIEDAKRALDPSPLLNAVFGTGYPQCRQVRLPVGDAYGRIRDADTGEAWISDPQEAEFSDNRYWQTKWVQDVDQNGQPIMLDRDQWVATPKTHQPNGKRITSESFTTYTSPAVVLVLGVICFAAFSFIKH